jgi:hypothetical protein
MIIKSINFNDFDKFDKFDNFGIYDNLYELKNVIIKYTMKLN